MRKNMMKIAFLLPIIFLLAACMPGPQDQLNRGTNRPVPPLDANELALIRNPSQDFLRQVDRVLPESVAQLRQIEAVAIKNGRPLNPREMEIARRVGVRQADKVRIYFTDDFPVDAASASGNGELVALTAVYGIYIHPIFQRPTPAYYEILAHELYHVVQFENEGVEGLSRRFLIERNLLPDTLIPIEREAIIGGSRVYDDPNTKYGV